MGEGVVISDFEEWAWDNPVTEGVIVAKTLECDVVTLDVLSWLLVFD